MEIVNNDSEFFSSGESFNAPECWFFIYFFIFGFYLGVADFLQSVRPGEETKRLHNLRQSLTTRSNNAADQIKDIVFDHYKQFIDTSKEISSQFHYFIRQNLWLDIPILMNVSLFLSYQIQ